MKWRLLNTISSLVPGQLARGQARTDFPTTLYDDHFPSYAVTPGVLLVEMCAQLAGKLIVATVWERSGIWVFPVLSIVQNSKFRRFVGPGSEVELRVELEELRSESAILRGDVSHDGRRCVNLTLVFVFDEAGDLAFGDPQTIKAWEHAEFTRLGSPWIPAPPGDGPSHGNPGQGDPNGPAR